MDGIKDKLSMLLAQNRHNQLGVTYGRKKVAIMAVDMMLADEILAIPEIADALRLKPVKPMNLGHSIKVNPPK